MELTDLLFAYGAEMDRGTLRSRCGGGEVVSAAFLSGCQMAFFGHDPVWDGGMETLVAGDSGVWGVLYRLTASAWEKLDMYKGATLDGAGNYFHYPVDVVTPGGGSCLVRAYKKSTNRIPHCPSSEYVNLLLKGAVENGLPLAYQDFLRSIPSEPAKYAVPRTDGKKRGSLVVLDGGSCGPGCG